MDGFAFESMNDVVTEMNAEFAAADIGLVAAYSRGGDTFTFTVTEGARMHQHARVLGERAGEASGLAVT